MLAVASGLELVIMGVSEKFLVIYVGAAVTIKSQVITADSMGRDGDAIRQTYALLSAVTCLSLMT